MENSNYIKLYKENENLFNKYFGDKATIYSELCLCHWREKTSFEALSEQYNYSVSQVKRIISNVQEFLQNPIVHLEEMKGSIHDLNGEIRIPNAFIYGKYNLSAIAIDIFDLCIYWFQHKITNKIHVSYLVSMSAQLKNRTRRKKYIDELSNFSILLQSGENLKVFKTIIEEDFFLKFEFTEECLDYIDPVRAFFKTLIDFHSNKK